MFDLSGKRALVTGASGGIGAEIAKALAANGVEVALSGTREAVLEQLSSEIATKSHVVACDLSDMEQVDQLVVRAIAAMGGVDILVNNAGLTRDNIFMRLKNEDWDQVIAVNLTAAFRLSRAVLRPMMKQRFGRIIAISSVVGVAGNAGQANYAASKAGLIAMSKSLAQEVASRNITVNSIAPGFIASAMTDQLNEKQRQNILAQIPAGRLGTAEEIAAGVVYLASGSAAYITGQTLNINGGMLMV
ncbi:3-oxoacyl-[acyl-carrier protein] reductase [hydrothermal vent metagenome]|uniref:3-oxoacyl-[acyl-carrier protein] reductase n=1 Tax=hydrothermal vent metagenome TaxID=652676 RepID=A0A3B0TUQ8_9ZZZZ